MNIPIFPVITFVVCAASVGWSVKVTKDAEKERAAMEEKVRFLQVDVQSLEAIHNPYSPASKQWLEKEKEWDSEFDRLARRVRSLEYQRKD